MQREERERDRVSNSQGKVQKDKNNQHQMVLNLSDTVHLQEFNLQLKYVQYNKNRKQNDKLASDNTPI